ncbi:YybH family protein [Sphingobacterium detergens]|uniref:Ketosteroid isomerase-like protein n=1 Tax=Sphingobacterium detergens TaxID=1145106 RepID=A0A420BK81_SPHD1|nr:nuclear transport factor 2 family protein [Sphingobacterium detergens]RKE57087.1 ketosteroid isomerase-like protein [Sphingobacterium detergens]
MKKITAWAALLLIGAAVQHTANGQTKQLNSSKSIKSTTIKNQSAQQQIEKSLTIYFDALNKSSVEQAIGQYTTDGIFMPTGLPTATGTAQLKIAYTNVFKAIQLNVKFDIEEINLSGDIAFVRTQSHGTQLIHATGQKTEELNREFFLLKRENGTWKIARYMFNQPK